MKRRTVITSSWGAAGVVLAFALVAVSPAAGAQEDSGKREYVRGGRPSAAAS
jgi:hypothetical protein